MMTVLTPQPRTEFRRLLDYGGATAVQVLRQKLIGDEVIINDYQTCLYGVIDAHTQQPIGGRSLREKLTGCMNYHISPLEYWTLAKPNKVSTGEKVRLTQGARDALLEEVDFWLKGHTQEVISL